MSNKTEAQTISIRLGGLRDADMLHSLKYQAFLPLYEKYQDHDTSPATEQPQKIFELLMQDEIQYYLILFDGKEAGGICIRNIEEKIFRIAPIFILPEFQKKGIASHVLKLIFELYPEADTWRLEAIQQETDTCRLYEKLGFQVTGERKRVNDKMEIISYEKKVNEEVE